jgi:tetratricopeptide (TPR) repeat protein
MGLFDFFKLKKKGIDNNLFFSDSYLMEITALAEMYYLENNHDYSIVMKKLENDGLDEFQCNHIVERLKWSIAKKVKIFQNELDSGAIEEIKIIPNPEHKKGKVDQKTIDRYISFGAFQIDQGYLDNALELLDKAIELDDKDTLAYANKGSLFSKKGDNEKALQFYNKALEIEPNHIQVLENKMDLLFEMMNESNENEFINTVKSILKNDPNHPNALIYIIQYYLKGNDIENALISVKSLFTNFFMEEIAIKLFLEIFDKLPQDRALYELGVFKESLKDDAKYQLQYCKGLYLKGKGRYDEAILEFEYMNQIQEFSWSYYQMAIIKNLQDKTNEALDLLRTTFRLEAELKTDAKQYIELQNLWTNPTFMEITK